MPKVSADCEFGVGEGPWFLSVVHEGSGVRSAADAQDTGKEVMCVAKKKKGKGKSKQPKPTY